MSEAPPEFVAQYALALARLCKRAGGARWSVGDESICDAAWRGARAAGALDRGGVEAYVDAIHAEDLSLAIACQAGESAPWEYFITSFRPALYASARAISRPSIFPRAYASATRASVSAGVERTLGRNNTLSRWTRSAGVGSALPNWLRY